MVERSFLTITNQSSASPIIPKSFLRLVGFVPQDYFSPPEGYSTVIGNQDVAGGILQYSVGSTNYILFAIKDGGSYLLNRDNLGHFYPGSIQNFSLGVVTFVEFVLCGQAVFNHPNGGPVMRYPLNNDGTINVAGLITNPTYSGVRGCNLVCEYDASSQTNIIWESCTYLLAYDAVTLQILFNSKTLNPAQIQSPTYFTPTGVNGQVYVANKFPSSILVYGTPS